MLHVSGLLILHLDHSPSSSRYVTQEQTTRTTNGAAPRVPLVQYGDSWIEYPEELG